MELGFSFNVEIATTLFLLSAILYTINYLTTKNLPPGPWGLPFLGYALFLGKKPHETVNELKKKYGDIITLKLGKESFIFLSSYKILREALVKQSDVFSSRPIHHYPDEFASPPGIILSIGEMNAELRRFTLAKLKDFGYGKSSLELQLKDEIAHFLKEIEPYINKPIPNINTFIRKSIFNVICVFVTGQRYEYTDQTFCSLSELLSEHVERVKITNLENYIPNSLRIPSLMKFLGIKTMSETGNQILTILSKIVDEFDVKGKDDENLIDTWLTETRKNTNKYLTKKELVFVILDLFLAGSDTTTNILTWSVLYMMAYPQIQAKVQQEIDDVIGRERTPSMDDMKLMPYTQATMLEISRIVTVVPLGVEHMTSKDTILNGYFIPKNSPVITNLWAIHHDPGIFQQPNEFKPERFLTDTGKAKRIEELIPFSIGKRQCLGKSLARMEFFLYFTSMLQQFSFKEGDGSEVDLDYNYTIVSVPNPQSIYVTDR